jgi:glycosyltransferase involved in cell wall biosynthesis
MRLWLITTSYPRRPSESINAGVVARDLALELADLGHSVVVITPDKPDGVEFDEAISGVTIPWVRPSIQLSDISATSPIDGVRVASLMISARFLLTRLGRAQRPDGVIALWALPSGVFARWTFRQTQAPYSVWMLGSDVWRARDLPLGRSTLTRVLQDASHVFADGPTLAEEAARLTAVSAQFLPSVRRLPAPRRSNRAEIDVLFVGRYHPNKGPDVLLEALAMVKSRGLRFRAVFHGSGEMQDDLNRQVAVSDLGDCVELLGPIEAQGLADRLASTRVLVIPSRIESIPLVLGDAVQAKTPVIATRVGDMGGLVEELGIGLTVSPMDPGGIADAIQRVLQGEVVVKDWTAAGQLFSPGHAALRLSNAFTDPRPGHTHQEDGGSRHPPDDP